MGWLLLVLLFQCLWVCYFECIALVLLLVLAYCAWWCCWVLGLFVDVFERFDVCWLCLLWCLLGGFVWSGW